MPPQNKLQLEGKKKKKKKKEEEKKRRKKDGSLLLSIGLLGLRRRNRETMV
jgi:hypothetical protein